MLEGIVGESHHLALRGGASHREEHQESDGGDALMKTRHLETAAAGESCSMPTRRSV